MFTLEKEQVKIISEDVNKARITLTHLAEDLIDHICCEVENEMAGGAAFTDAYNKVRSLFGLKELQKIQENTLYLIDKNYRIMKTTMKISGLVSLSLLAFATVFKIFHWPGAGVGMVLGFLILCGVFYPAIIYLNYKESGKKKNVFLHISAFLGGGAFMTGVLFKIMHWPGAGLMLFGGLALFIMLYMPILLYVRNKNALTRRDKTVNTLVFFSLITFVTAITFKLMHWPGAGVLLILGSVSLVCIALPVYTWGKFRETGKITGQYIFIITAAVFFVLFTFLLAINVSRDTVGNFVNDEENSLVLINYFEKKNNNLASEIKNKPDSLYLTNDSSAQAIHNNAQEICGMISDIKIRLIMAGDAVDRQTASKKICNPQNIVAKDNRDLVYALILDINNNENFAKLLKTKIDAYSELIKESFPSDKRFETILNKSFDTSDKNIEGQNKTWEDYNFGTRTIISAFTVLSDIELNILLLEKEILESVKQKQVITL
jgi:hypothetical protein